MFILNQLLNDSEKQLGFILIDDSVSDLLYLKRNGELLSAYSALTVTIKQIRNDIDLWVNSGIIFGRN
mgnify:FL=1